jgi:hypothetical protein
MITLIAFVGLSVVFAAVLLGLPRAAAVLVLRSLDRREARHARRAS